VGKRFKVNFVKHKYFVVRISKNQSVFSLFLTVLLSIYLAGCSDQVRLPSAVQLAEIENTYGQKKQGGMT